MKRFFAVLMLAVLATVLFVMPVLAQGETPLEPVLDPTQVVLVGIVTTVLLNVFRLIYEYARKKKWQCRVLCWRFRLAWPGSGSRLHYRSYLFLLVNCLIWSWPGLTTWDFWWQP